MIAFMAQRDPRAAVVEDLLGKTGRSVRWLALKHGIQPQKLHNWLNGVNSPRDPAVWDELLASLQKAMADGDIAKLKSLALHRSGTRHIPVYGGMVAGPPGSYTGDVDWIEIKDWGNHFDRWGRVIQGFSMEPVIMPGDVVIFENSRPIEGHVVHAYSDDGEDTCKVWHDGKLYPINPAFEAIPMAEGQKWIIKGVAVMIIRQLQHGNSVTFDFPSGLRHVIS